jgi:hypothetical protein
MHVPSLRFLSDDNNTYRRGKEVDRMSQRDPQRWRSKFARFVSSYGSSRLAKELGVDPSAITHWIRAITKPKPEYAAAMRGIARKQGTRLTLDDIYRHAFDRRAADRSIGIQIERRKVLRGV